MTNLYCSKCLQFRPEGKDCSSCGDPLLDISNEDVVELLAQEDNRKITKRSSVFIAAFSPVAVLGLFLAGWFGLIVGAAVTYICSVIVSYRFPPKKLHYFIVGKHSPYMSKLVNLPRKFKIVEPIKDAASSVISESSEIAMKAAPGRSIPKPPKFNEIGLEYLRFGFVVAGVLSLVAMFAPYLSLGNMFGIEIGATAIQLAKAGIRLFGVTLDLGGNRDGYLAAFALCLPCILLAENAIHSLVYVFTNRASTGISEVGILFVLFHAYVFWRIKKTTGIDASSIISLLGAGFYIGLASVIVSEVSQFMYRKKAKRY
jgi:hypothetical protein